MRELTFGEVTVMIPENLVFMKDNNYITCESANHDYKVWAKITIQGTTNGKNVVLSYTSNTHFLSLDLNDAFRIVEDTEIQYIFQIALNTDGAVYNMQSGPQSPYYSTLINGMTLPTRYHGSTFTINAHDMSDVQVFVPYTCHYTFGNEVSGLITAGVNSLNLGTFAYRRTPLLHIYGFGTNVEVGDIYNSDSVDNYDIKIIKMKDDGCKKMVLVRYTDTDGCKRIIRGGIESLKTSTEGQQYKKPNLHLYTPCRKMTGATIELAVSFMGVPHDMNITDIVYADDIEVCMDEANNVWQPSVLATTSVTEYGKQQDYTFTFKVLG